MGMIVGPALGGLLSRPALLYPNLFSKTGLWGRYPYLLPCLCCSSLAVIAGVLIYHFVPETVNSSHSLTDSDTNDQNNTEDETKECRIEMIPIENIKSNEI